MRELRTDFNVIKPTALAHPKREGLRRAALIWNLLPGLSISSVQRLDAEQMLPRLVRHHRSVLIMLVVAPVVVVHDAL